MVVYVISLLYTQCLRYNICNTWFLDIRISTCYLWDEFSFLNSKTGILIVFKLAMSYNLSVVSFGITKIGKFWDYQNWQVLYSP